MIVDQVNLPILQKQLHIDLRITTQEFGHVRMNHETPHRLGHADADAAFSLLSELPTDFHHRPSGGDHFLTALEHLFPAIAQTQLAGGALQQAGRQGFLQARNTAADGRRG
ncbi:hypothetical protein D3C78_1252530 [compost metagenome]